MTTWSVSMKDKIVEDYSYKIVHDKSKQTLEDMQNLHKTLVKRKEHAQEQYNVVEGRRDLRRKAAENQMNLLLAKIIGMHNAGTITLYSKPFYRFDIRGVVVSNQPSLNADFFAPLYQHMNGFELYVRIENDTNLRRHVVYQSAVDFVRRYEVEKPVVSTKLFDVAVGIRGELKNEDEVRVEYDTLQKINSEIRIAKENITRLKDIINKCRLSKFDDRIILNDCDVKTIFYFEE